MPINRDFFETDREHSQYKRIILRNVLGAVFPYYWQSGRGSELSSNGDNEASMYYLDGFGGSGRYGGSLTQRLEDDVSLFGSPIIAVHKAIEALKNLGKTCDDYRFYKAVGAKSYVVKFFFNEFNSTNLTSLKEQVVRRFDLHGWRRWPLASPENCVEESMVFSGAVALAGGGEKKLKIKVEFLNQRFENLNLSAIPSPLFSFVDPFGIAQIPMSSVSQLIGPDREIFLNLMVATINRHFDRPGTAVEKLYGPCMDDNFVELARLFDGLDKLQFLADHYFQSVDREFRIKESDSWPDGYHSVKFAFRKGTTDPDVGTIYYMGFASCKLNFMQIAKQGMMKVTDEPLTLSFSQFYRKNRVDIPYERKTTDRDEAEVILDHFEGQTIELGQIRKWILLETAFVYHSKALKFMEDRLFIVNVDSLGEKRIMGTFSSRVPLSVYQSDGVQHYQKYHNRYKVTFCSEDLKTKLMNFIESEPDIDAFKGFLLEKLSQFSTCTTRKELMSQTSVRVRKMLKVTGMNNALKELEEENAISLDPPGKNICHQTIQVKTKKRRSET